MFTAKLGHRNTAFCLAKDCKDLWLAKSAHLHRILLDHIAEKILLLKPVNLRGDYRWKSLFLYCGISMQKSDEEDEIIMGALRLILSANKIKFSDVKSRTNLSHIIRFQFEALGLIKSRLSRKEVEVADIYGIGVGNFKKDRKIVDYTQWFLTDAGQIYLARSFAKKRKAPEIPI